MTGVRQIFIQSSWLEYGSYIAQILTPVIGAIGLWFVVRQIKVSQMQSQAAIKAAEAAEEQAKATQDSVERMKDNLLPRLKLQLTNHLYGGENGIALVVRNIGPGVATCSLLTMRNDVRTTSAFRPVKLWTRSDFWVEPSFQEEPITDYDLGSGDTVTFHLPLDSQFSVTNDYALLSSISLFYQDIYSRLYRSRVLYVWHKEDKLETVEIIGHEYLYPVTLPMNPYTSSDVRIYGEIEGEKTVRDIPVFRILHFEKSKLEISGKVIPGIKFTRGVSVVLDTYSFAWGGFPIYSVRVEGCPAVRVSYLRQENNHVTVRIQPAELGGDYSYDELGLQVNADSEAKQKVEFYIHITRELLRHFKTDLQREYPDFLVL